VEALIALIEVVYVATLGFKSISVLTNGICRKSKEPPKMATRPAKATLPFGPNVQVKTKLIVLEQNHIPVKKQTTRRTTLKRPRQTPRMIQVS